MKFYNINDPSEKVSLRQAVLRSLSGSSGLYLPEQIPVLPPTFFKNLKSYELKDTAFEVSKSMLGDDIPLNTLEEVIGQAFTFPIPLRQLKKDLYVLELFHGPTLAFKDVGARFMAGLFTWLVRGESREVTILTATSGDTGSAVANAFFGKGGIKVIILYPSGKVSEIQEKQLTTMGGNITALEVNGDFDDCQSLVKMAFGDMELNAILNLTSANSINFARLFPQSFYYFHAMAQLPENKNPVAISVPSGNFGNLTAGLIAKKMGLPVNKFIASCNSNHAVSDYLSSGIYKPSQTIKTISNAMDVGNPNNFPRIAELYNKDHVMVTKDLSGFWYNDDDTRRGMVELYKSFGYQADPHGAVAYLGLTDYLKNNNCTGIFIETAHPAKFADEVESSTGVKVSIPQSLLKLKKLRKNAVKIDARFKDLKEILIQGSI